MKIERTKNATKNITFGIILKLYQIIIPFLMRTAMIKFLGVEYLGLNSLFTSVLQVLNLAELGVGSAMVFSMYKPIAIDDEEKICSLMRLYKIYYRVIGAVILILGLAITPFIPYLIKNDLPSNINIYILYILNLMATVLSYWLFAYKNCLLQAHQRLDIISKITLCINTIQYILQFTVLYIFRNYYLYIIISLLTQIIINVTTAIIVNRMYPKYKAKGKLEKNEIKTINQRVKDLFTAKLGGVIVSSVDTIIISAFLGLTNLAVYQNYYYILNSVYGLVLIIFSSVTAGIGNSFVVESLEKNYKDLTKFTFIVCWLNCVCVCCFACLYQPFMKIWIGKEYMLNYLFVILFCIYFYILVLNMVWATIKDAVGLWHQDRYRPLIGAFVNLILNIILVQCIGLYGILLSTILSYVLISMPWLVHNIFKYLYKKPMKKYIIQLLKYIITCIICCCLSIFICNMCNFDGIIKIVINGVICIIISNTFQYMVFNKLEEFKESKKLIMKMIKIGG